MVSECMMRKTKKSVIEAEKASKENGDFMQLRSRRLDKSAAASVELFKKRNWKKGSFHPRNSNSTSKGNWKSELAVEEVVVVEKKEDELEENVGQGVCFNEGGVAQFDVSVGPIGGGGGAGAVEIEGVDGSAAAPIYDGIESEEVIVGDYLQPIDREIRECTPEHLIVRSDYIIATGSSTVAPRDDVAARGPPTNRRLHGGCVPSVKSIENLFAAAEMQQETLFMEKYNFDFKNETPLPGRYEWVKVEP